MVESKLNKLLDSLSIDQKIGQLVQLNGAVLGDKGALVTGELDGSDFPAAQVRNIGSVLSVYDPEKIKEIQDIHLSQNPIPLMFMVDVIHGATTVYPVALAQGCSFDVNLSKRLSEIAAREASQLGIHVTFSPMVDLVRDPRWGRVVESYGEDTLLNSLMGAAAVKGYQGKGLSEKGTVAACVKHFAGYGAAEGGRDYDSVSLSEHDLLEYYLPSYHSALKAGAEMIMSSFNTLNGMPAVINKKLAVDILRNKWGFEGVSITDYGALELLKNDGVSDNYTDSARIALERGTDIDMMSVCYINGLHALEQKGELDTEALNRAVMRVLKLKNKLGLFENPYRFLQLDKEKRSILLKENRIEAQNSVPKCSVLLKNDNRILPLNKDCKIAFIGAFVESRRLTGPWCFETCDSETVINLREAIERLKLSKAPLFEVGCSLRMCNDAGKDKVEANDGILLHKALSAAKQADVVVMAVGEDLSLSGECRSRGNITVPENQIILFEKVYEVNRRIVVVLFNGRPLDITNISERASAVLEVWHPGSEGAKPIADMLFGYAIPSGKLSMSFPKTVAQIPVYHNILPAHYRNRDPKPGEYISDFKTRYIDCSGYPLYPFGYGLSYTTFEYSDTFLSSDRLTADTKIIASAKISNTGEYDAEETVQLYLRDPVASISRPVRELKGFKRIMIPSGETMEVNFEIDEEMLKFYDEDGRYISEPGEFRVIIAPNSMVDLVDDEFNAEPVQKRGYAVFRLVG